MIEIDLFKSMRYALGLTAMVMAILFIFCYPTNIFILAASSYLFLICASDTLYSKIPNIFTLALIVIGLSTNIAISGLPGIMVSITGFTIGLSLLLIPFLMGGMGAGDVKALTALGTLLGPDITFQLFLYMGIIGGLLGLLFHLTNPGSRVQLRHYISSLKNAYLTRDFKSFSRPVNRSSNRFPYATAIAFGFFAQTFWGSLW
ncbi:A24 family peptidase [Syntrophotalea acetylenica]|uniref:Prepilin type IV endopeptidase peptidase domain-containing protein n=1 Tax=Syntrophotalea acetylenica TaxID=29542 RepID=A0A1L3GIN4_SYNAC|nr:A24 family peptidase [Syntrophotalea acetylenica]APG25745.1 hypothetical protein A7E75_12535 [Syntrophotalea acetylenica]APG43819.1 hypothetical protein A6070_06550 [Syntrophotalea acetylenica]